MGLLDVSRCIGGFALHGSKVFVVCTGIARAPTEGSELLNRRPDFAEHQRYFRHTLSIPEIVLQSFVLLQT